jgi:RNA polymerase sigma factor (sigma-70 family)
MTGDVFLFWFPGIDKSCRIWVYRYGAKARTMTGAKKPVAYMDYQSLADTQRVHLVRRAHTLLGDMAEAEDVVQATLLAVWEKVRQGEIDDAGAYLRKAVEWNSLKRRARRRRTLSLDGLDEIVTAPDIQADDEDEIDPAELETALEGLPQRQQAVIRMKYYTGLTFREIAEAMSIPANTAASACRYGLAAMKKKLTHKEND